MKTILAIEDEEDILFSIKCFLELEGYSVQTASNGLEGLEQLNKGIVPSLILLDMKLPVMNGWEFAEKFRAKYDNLCPILVMTAAPDSKQRAKDVGAVDWVSKPFNLDELLAKIKKYEV